MVGLCTTSGMNVEALRHAAYMGTAMDEFPNFIIATGPNTANGHSSLILESENITDIS